LKTGQNAAEVSGIEPQILREFDRGGVFALSQFVERPELSERERAVQQTLIEKSNLAGVEAVKATHGSDALIEGWLSEDWGHERKYVEIG
jgi:hypothetical protein